MTWRTVVALTCVIGITGCSTARPVSSTMFAARHVVTAIRAFEAYGVNESVEDLSLTCTTAEVLFQRNGRWHDVVQTLAGHVSDDVSADGPPGPQVSFSLRAINAAGPARLINALRQRLGDAEFLPVDVGVGDTSMGARGVSNGRAVWFQSAADGGDVHAIPVPTVPLAHPTCAAG